MQKRNDFANTLCFGNGVSRSEVAFMGRMSLKDIPLTLWGNGFVVGL